MGLSAVALLAGGAFAVSAYSSYQEISRLKTDFESVQKVKSRAEKVATLIRLQQDITDLESRRSFSQYAVKFLGYEHRQELLAVAYRKYNNLAKDVISRPATAFFENKLDELVMLEGRIPDDFELQDSAYQDLKAYLMLTSHVEKTKGTKDAEFLVTKLTQMLTTQNVAAKDAQTLAQFLCRVCHRKIIWQSLNKLNWYQEAVRSWWTGSIATKAVSNCINALFRVRMPNCKPLL